MPKEKVYAQPPKGPAKGRHVRVNRTALKYAIKGTGMTHAQLAKRAGLASDATVSNLVAPKGRDTCRPETAKAIAKALGLSVNDTLGMFTVVLSSDH